MHPIFGNVPDATRRRSCRPPRCGRRARLTKDRRRFRCASRQLAALRLAVIRRLHVQRPGGACATVPARPAPTPAITRGSCVTLTSCGGERDLQQRAVPGGHRVRAEQEGPRRRTSTTTARLDHRRLELRHRRASRGVYERLKYDTPTGDLKRDFWGVSGTMPMGPGVVVCVLRPRERRQGRRGGRRARSAGLGKGSDTGSNQWEISYTYPFSKRTSVYAGYVKIDNDSNASYTFNINPYPIGDRRQAARVRAGHDSPVLSSHRLDSRGRLRAPVSF